MLNVFGILIAISCLLSNCLTLGNIKDRMTKTFPVGSGGTLAIESDIGSISAHLPEDLGLDVSAKTTGRHAPVWPKNTTRNFIRNYRSAKSETNFSLLI